MAWQIYNRNDYSKSNVNSKEGCFFVQIETFNIVFHGSIFIAIMYIFLLILNVVTLITTFNRIGTYTK